LRDFADLEGTNSSRMNTDPYCHQQNCSLLNVGHTFHRCSDYIDIAGRSSARVYNQNMAISNLYTRYVANGSVRNKGGADPSKSMRDPCKVV